MHRFYDPSINGATGTLSAEESRHCALILRNTTGNSIEIMDGKGGRHQAILTSVAKNSCQYEVVSSEIKKPKPFTIHLAIAPTKNMDRMEWMVEKLCEIGVDQITFMVTQNSERSKLRLDRLEKKVISAMKQSGNPFLPTLKHQATFDTVISSLQSEVNLIAHVNPKHKDFREVIQEMKDTTLIIGPEGDFTRQELDRAIAHEVIPVSLGTNTLRTETAGFVACCFFNFINRF